MASWLVFVSGTVLFLEKGRALASILTKLFTYFSFKTYFLYFTVIFQNIPHQIIYFTLHFIIILFLYQFFIILPSHISLSLSLSLLFTILQTINHSKLPTKIIASLFLKQKRKTHPNHSKPKAEIKNNNNNNNNNKNQ